MTRRHAAALSFAALVLVVTAGPPAMATAAAAPLGAITLSVTAGTVDATPIFAQARSDRPCPAGFGANVQLRVGPPGGPYSNLARPMSAGGYDRAPVTARPNRSFGTALGGAPVDGEWWVVFECISATAGVHPERFVTPITVSGNRWRAGRPANAPAPATARPADGAPAPTVGQPDPAATSGGPAGGPAGGPTGAAPTASAADPQLVGSARRGSASLGGAVWIAGLAAVLVIVGVVHLLTRRRPSRR